MKHDRRIDRALNIIRAAAALCVALLCAGVLAGPRGDDITASGTTAAVLLAFLIPAYIIGGMRRWPKRAAKTTS